MLREVMILQWYSEAIAAIWIVRAPYGHIGVPFLMQPESLVKYQESRKTAIVLPISDLIAKLEETNVGVRVKYHKMNREEGSEGVGPSTPIPGTPNIQN